jgi:hypothetical protein
MDEKIDIYNDIARYGHTLSISLKDKDGNIIAEESNHTSSIFDWTFDCTGSNFDLTSEVIKGMMSYLAIRLENKRIVDIRKNSSKFEWSFFKEDVLDNYELQRDWNQTLLPKIHEASKGVKTDNETIVVVAPPEAMVIIEDLKLFNNEANPSKKLSSMTQRMGHITLGETKLYEVYKNPYMPSDEIIVCRKDDLDARELPDKFVSSIVKIKGLRTINDFKNKI